MIRTRLRTLHWSVALATLFSVSSCKEGTTLEASSTKSLQPGALIDLGAVEVHERLEGFFDPERVGRRSTPWSQGRLSVLPFELKPVPGPYELALLVEPYFGALPLKIGLTLNDQFLAEVEILSGWRAYQVRVDASRLREGTNKLVLTYSKIARPADVEAGSFDAREIAVRVDQVQLQPIGERAELALDMKSAISRAAMTEGWGIDENDRYAGVWTLGPRAVLNVPLSRFGATAYALALTAQTQSGVPEQSVTVRLNGAALGTLRFEGKRSTQRLEVPRTTLAYDNLIELGFDELKPPSEINPQSRDQRLLGLRLLELDLVPE